MTVIVKTSGPRWGMGVLVTEDLAEAIADFTAKVTSAAESGIDVQVLITEAHVV